MTRTLIVDVANGVGSKPDGWRGDRAGAATRLRDALTNAELPYDEVILVLEGQAKRSTPPGRHGGIVIARAEGGRRRDRRASESGSRGRRRRRRPDKRPPPA